MEWSKRVEDAVTRKTGSTAIDITVVRLQSDRIASELYEWESRRWYAEAALTFVR